MRQGQIGMTLDVAGYETAMEGEDMRAVVLTLDRGQTVPWHYHSTITDSFVCLKGPIVVETRAPRKHLCAERRRALRGTAKDGAPCSWIGRRAMPVQGAAGYRRLRQCARRWRGKLTALGAARGENGAARFRRPRGRYEAPGAPPACS
jgi:hypothetical protein